MANTTVGEERPNHKLTERDVREIRRRWKTGGFTQRFLARQFGVSQTVICNTVNGNNWAHVK